MIDCVFQPCGSSKIDIKQKMKHYQISIYSKMSVLIEQTEFREFLDLNFHFSALGWYIFLFSLPTLLIEGNKNSMMAKVCF